MDLLEQVHHLKLVGPITVKERKRLLEAVSLKQSLAAEEEARKTREVPLYLRMLRSILL